MARPSAQQLDHGQHQRADLVGGADDRPQLHRPGEVELADLQPDAGRSLGLHPAGQLQPVVPARRGAGCRRHVRPDPVGVQGRVAAAGHQHRADVDLCRLRVVRDRFAQHQDRRADPHRRVAGAVRDPRRHRADRQQRRAQLGAPGQQPERPQGVGRRHRGLHPGFVAARAGDDQPRPALLALRHVDPRPECGGWHVGAGARLRGAGQHRQLEHALAALRPGVGHGRRRAHGAEGRHQPLRPSRRGHAGAAAERQEHRLPDLPVDRHQQRPAGAERRDRAPPAAARCSRAWASSIPTRSAPTSGSTTSRCSASSAAAPR